MYTNFSVRGFRGLGHLELDRLTLVTVITGRNGVGKSSLLEAIFLHGCGSSAGISALQVVRPMRHLPGVTLQSDGRLNPPWDPFFPMDQPQVGVELMATVDGEVRVLEMFRTSTPNTLVISGRGESLLSAAAAVSLDVTTRRGDAEAVHHRTTATSENGGQVSIATVPEASEPWTRARIVKGPGAVDVQQEFSNLRRDGRDAPLVATLRAVDPRISGVELLVGDGGNVLHAHLGAGAPVPMTSLGDGVNNVLTHLLSMTATEGGILLVDELEKGLHHSIFPEVWRALVEMARATGTQLVVSTHSEECIAAVAEVMADDLDRLTLLRLRRTDEDLVQEPGRPISCVTYSGQRVSDAVDLSVEVR